MSDENAMQVVDDAAYSAFKKGEPYPFRKAIEDYEACRQAAGWRWAKGNLHVDDSEK